MKSLLIIIAMIFSVNYASAVEVSGIVKHVEFSVNDDYNSPSLCISYIHNEEEDKVYGVVEDLYDCFYAREFSQDLGSFKQIDVSSIFEMEQELIDHLEARKDNVQYVLSDLE